MPPRTIEIKDLELNALEYKERTDGGRLEIEFTTLVSAELDRRLCWLFYRGESFQVLPQGGTAREMRFGRPFWSEHPEGIRYHLVLVETASDQSQGGEFGFVGMLEMDRQFLAAAYGRLDALLNVLADKGLLTTDEAKQLRDPDMDRNAKALHRMHRVRDAYLTWNKE
jgi:hypothetical protein